MDLLVDIAVPIVVFMMMVVVGMELSPEDFRRIRACPKPVVVATAGQLLVNLRMDPFERAQEENAMGYQRWYLEHMFAIAPASAYVANWLQSFRDFPPRQKPGSFNLDRVMETLTTPNQ
jgi:hypothetical protein